MRSISAFPPTTPLQQTALLPPLQQGENHRAALHLRSGGKPLNLADNARLMGATYLKVINPLLLGSVMGGGVFQLWRWPFILTGMGLSYLGGLGAERLSTPMLKNLKHLDQLLEKRRYFYHQTGSRLMLNILKADLSGLLVDPNTYAAIDNKTKYDYLLTQVNKIGAHFLGIYQPGERSSPIQQQIRRQAQIRLERLQRKAPNAPRKALAAKMNLEHPQQVLPRLAKAVNLMTHNAWLRRVTVTPLMWAIPKIEPSPLNGKMPPPMWIRELPIVGGALADKVSSLAKARRLYFRTDARGGDIEQLYLTHHSAFVHYVKRTNEKLKALGVPEVEHLKTDDAHFRAWLAVKSRQEKQAAVRLLLYKMGFNLYVDRTGNLAQLLQRWHDVDAAALRSMFDVAQCLNFRQGLHYLASNAVNEVWERLTVGGFSAVLEFGVAQLPPPVSGPARLLARLVELGFDIQRKPITKQPFSYRETKA